jgi:hypothetical protein
MSKKPTAANQDYYKVSGRSPRPNEHELELQKREARENADRSRKAEPQIAPKTAEPGKKEKADKPE